MTSRTHIYTLTYMHTRIINKQRVAHTRVHGEMKVHIHIRERKCVNFFAVVLDLAAYVVIIFLEKPFPAWLYSSLFYIQVSTK